MHNLSLNELKDHLSKISDPETRNLVRKQYFFWLEFGNTALPEKTVVVLIHGIRTSAEWQEQFRGELEQVSSDIKVIPLGYEYFDSARFWFPFYFRNKPVARILQQLRNVQSDHNGYKLIVIAHSFGTYIISKILKTHPDIRVEKILLCGSVIPPSFRWDMIPKKPNLILNEVGDIDIWPVLARFLSLGYGASGTFGFKSNEVTDKYHHIKHSDFFKLAHIKTYWIPYILFSQFVTSPYELNRKKQSCIFQLLNLIPLPYIVIALGIWKII